MTDFDALADALLNDKPIPTSEQAKPADPGVPVTTPPAAEPVISPVDTPLVDTPTPTPTQEPPTPPKTADSSDWISNVAKIAGEEIKTEEDLKSFLAKAKNAKDLESQHSTISEELKALKASQVQFANDKIKKLNELYSNGATEDQIDAFHKIQSVGDLKQLNPLDTVKLALQLRDGLTPQEADIKIKNTYKLDESVYDADQIAASNVELKLTSKNDLEYLEKHKVQVSTTPNVPSPEETQAAAQAALDKEIADYKVKVAPIVDSIKEDFTAVKGVNVNGKQGDDALLLDLPVSEESKAQVASWVTDYAAANNIPLTKEGIEHLKQFARRTLILNNFDNIAIDINNKAEERIRTEYNNPANIDRGIDPPAPAEATRAAKLLNHVLEM